MTCSKKKYIGGGLVSGRSDIDAIGPATVGPPGLRHDCAHLALTDYPSYKRISRPFVA